MYCQHSLHNFVQETCGNREPSHGIDHFKRVRDKALAINDSLSFQVKKEDIILVAMLHDVADHKYDHDGSLEKHLRYWLESQTDLDVQIIMDTISSISYSKERKFGMRWFESNLGPYWTRVRDIVSDADKLEAIGNIGGLRCLQYAQEHGYNDKNAVKHLVENILEKLIYIKDKYLVTDLAKQLAESLHEDLLIFGLKSALEHI